MAKRSEENNLLALLDIFPFYYVSVGAREIDLRVTSRLKVKSYGAKANDN